YFSLVLPEVYDHLNYVLHSKVRNIVRKQFVLVTCEFNKFIMEIINTKRGGKKIIFENVVYVKQKLVKVGVRWNCGSITTDESIKVIISTTDHNHSACPVEVEVAKTLSLMKNNAKNHSEPSSIIFSKATINLSNEAKLLMPAENSIKRSLRRVKNASYPPLISINELKVTGIWATTGGENPQPFLLYDNQNNENRIIIFSSPESLELLKTNSSFGVHSSSK
ncbi:hypothetical protein AGLY_005716, partial [Aphis glycines]